MGHPADSEEASQASTTDRTITDFRAASAHHWRAAFLRGDVTAVELATSALTAAATQESLGAFSHVDTESALARAAELDAVRSLLISSGNVAGPVGVPAAQPPAPSAGASGTSTGQAGNSGYRIAELSAKAPLMGLPTAFKDLVPVAGMPNTLGTAALPPVTPAKDAPLARQVHSCGALSIGKTQVPEFGLPAYSESRISAPSRNPLDPTRISGGSTGGGAAAVAAGILPFAPGNDGGGSIRIPAAACGLVGLKPGRARIPSDRQQRTVINLGTSGPIARTPEDAALLFDVMAGHRFAVPGPGALSGKSKRKGAQDLPLAEGPAMRRVRSALAEGLDALHVGVTTESPFSPDLDIVLAEGAVLALEQGLAALGREGHYVQGTDHCTGTDRFWPEGYHQDFQTLWTSRMAGLSFTEEQEELLEPLTRYFLTLARNRPPEETSDAVGRLQEFSSGAEEFFGPWDVLVTPMLASAPPAVGWFASLDPEENYIEQCRFTPYSSVVNVLGLPAINVPMHTDADGLSWSMQVIGRQGSEELLLALAATLMRR